ncbi:MAG: hypothetical protein WC376_01140 [Candidatus Nanoarchaeia archaeon]|jgi:hypothetical protein
MDNDELIIEYNINSFFYFLASIMLIVLGSFLIISKCNSIVYSLPIAIAEYVFSIMLILGGLPLFITSIKALNNMKKKVPALVINSSGIFSKFGLIEWKEVIDASIFIIKNQKASYSSDLFASVFLKINNFDKFFSVQDFSNKVSLLFSKKVRITINVSKGELANKEIVNRVKHLINKYTLKDISIKGIY